ncbi:Uncharacterized protein OS=Pseudomonas mediterranea CFBP 5447 GN=N005_17510 PE=4 SV=1 [Gemmata massiliana]|uniref:DUF4239 domain-containing protein n=1 Tax=Gemmata massiliana TaxID=1210884 RepID=A0A6P2DIA1_9BACT|nr:hypothetical protein [Gemmata massiliana]VTS01771.1 Uncharacterized protein OS=Pseudomonas mediterranea CFBP 5447 GN=N005_17510 PE=4 SV=1 [Gemmata massiliana]
MLQDWPTWIIVVAILGLMLGANELGFRAGRRHHRNETELSRTVSNTFKGSIFGLVALLLGFSFSATTSRYDLRQRLVLDQSNAVGTCYLRAGLLDETSCTHIRGILRRYVEVRVEQYRAGREEAAVARDQAEIDRLLADLWGAVEDANRREPERVHKSSIVPASNEVIDLSSTRTWANRNHLPEPVLFLLMVSVLVTSLLLGHSSGQAERRHVSLWLASNAVFALVLFIVLDFDRPRRGLIRVDQTPFVELNASLGSVPAP